MRYPVVTTLLASAVRAATTNVDPQDVLFPNTTGGFEPSPPPPVNACSLIAYLNVTAVPGVDTVLLKMQELEPVTQTWVDTPGVATLAQVATGLIKMVVDAHVAAVAASASGVTANTVIPPNWRLVVVHSGAGNFTYSLAVAVEA